MRRVLPPAARRLPGLCRVLLLWLLACGVALGGTLQVEILDVGQGDGILITTPAGKRVLIDAGPAATQVLAQLQERGVDHLDLAVATHPHADHIGGMAAVLRGLPVKVFTDNGLPHTTRTYLELMTLIEEQGITYRPAQAGQSFSLDDGIRIEVLFPGTTALRNTRSDLNSNSVVLRLTHGDNCFLFTGDSEEPTESALMNAGLQPCGVLKVAHHGSSHSSSAALLRTLQPEIALISVGVDNRYGHPALEALDRLNSAGVTVYRTDLQGELLVESDGKRVVVTARGKEGQAVAEASTPARPRLPAGLPPPVSPPSARLPMESSTTAALAASTLDPDCRYIASVSSKVFHPATCHVVERIYSANRVCFASIAAAEASGRSRSQVCPDP